MATKLWQAIVGLVFGTNGLNEAKTVAWDCVQTRRIILWWLLKMLLIPAKLSATNQGWWRNLCHPDTLACLCLQPRKTPHFLLVPFAPSGILSVLSCLGLSVMKNFPALGHAHMLSFCIKCRPPIPFTTSECLVESGYKCHFLSVHSNAK